MIVNFDQLEETSKVYIYPSKAKLFPETIEKIKEKAQEFLTDFSENECAFDIKYNRILIIAIDDETPLTVSDLDKLSMFILDLEKEFETSLLDKMNICFKQGQYLQMKEVKEFKELIKKKSVSKKTILLDNFVNSKYELDNFWEVPAEESWISHFFK
ncbi:ABC transporter ATPase [Aureivirga sp. CE67]|uniref:ABC transporter ATPase n=1 Tax=Aureivirga sp. CE67 TaxID=1788983 RepID=UPI0018CA8FA2|nr:ABC transporter ATPase [Aureivirga sp. CE67]